MIKIKTKSLRKNHFVMHKHICKLKRKVVKHLDGEKIRKQTSIKEH